MLISFLIPVYNEEKRISKAIKELELYLATFKHEYEVLFIDDGSKDRTVQALKKAKTAFKYKILTYFPNRGKGYAIKRGMIAARGDFRLFFDCDMSTPLKEFDKFIPYLNPKVVLIGNRKRKGAQVEVHQPFIREKMGQVFTLIARLLIAGEVTDFTCGFKCFPRQAALKVFEKSTVDRWSYDAEILFLTKKYKYKIQQIPVSWADDPRTRVTIIKDSLQSLVDLLTIRWKNFRGLYNFRGLRTRSSKPAE